MVLTGGVLLQLLVLPLALASHFYGSHVTVTTNRDSTGNYGVQIRIKATYDGCHYNYGSCYQGNCGLNTKVESGQIDYSNNAPVHNRHWCETETIVTKMLSSDKPFSIRDSSCCWIWLSPGFTPSWSVLATVDLGRRSDTYAPNNSPEVAILSFLRVPQNCRRTYKPITSDPDGDWVRCRYGIPKSEECSECRQHHGFQVDQDSCTFQYQALGSLGVYGFELVVEDFPRNTVALMYSDGSSSYRYGLYARKKRALTIHWPTTTTNHTTTTNTTAMSGTAISATSITYAAPTTMPFGQSTPRGSTTLAPFMTYKSSVSPLTTNPSKTYSSAVNSMITAATSITSATTTTTATATTTTTAAPPTIVVARTTTTYPPRTMYTGKPYRPTFTSTTPTTTFPPHTSTYAWTTMASFPRTMHTGKPYRPNFTTTTTPPTTTTTTTPTPTTPTSTTTTFPPRTGAFARTTMTYPPRTMYTGKPYRPNNTKNTTTTAATTTTYAPPRTSAFSMASFPRTMHTGKPYRPTFTTTTPTTTTTVPPHTSTFAWTSMASFPRTVHTGKPYRPNFSTTTPTTTFPPRTSTFAWTTMTSTPRTMHTGKPYRPTFTTSTTPITTTTTTTFPPHTSAFARTTTTYPPRTMYTGKPYRPNFTTTTTTPMTPTTTFPPHTSTYAWTTMTSFPRTMHTGRPYRPKTTPTTITTTTPVFTLPTAVYGAPFSQLPLQFTFQVDPPAPSCVEGEYLPTFVSPTPRDGDVILAEAGREVQIRVKAGAQYSVLDSMIMTGPLNITKHRTTEDEFAIRWTPAEENLGRCFPICFVMEFTYGPAVFQSEMRCVMVNVTAAVVKTVVTCLESSMVVAVDKATLPPGLSNDHLSLSDSSNTVCSLQTHSNRTHVVAVVPLNACGTRIEEDDDDLLFKNEITTVDNTSSVITRSHQVGIKFFCQYAKRGNVTFTFSAHRDKVTVWDKGLGTFTYRFEFFPDQRFLTMIEPRLYPLEYLVGDRIHMKIEATAAVNNTELFVESCRATPYDTPHYQPSYSIIENGCTIDSTVVVYPSNIKTEFRFSIAAFKFIGLHDQVYISCSVLMCEAGNPHTRCSHGCQPNRPSRSRREAVIESGTHYVSQGPLRLRRPVEAAGGKGLNLNLNVVFITGSALAAVGMICGVIFYRTKASHFKYLPLATEEH